MSKKLFVKQSNYQPSFDGLLKKLKEKNTLKSSTPKLPADSFPKWDELSDADISSCISNSTLESKPPNSIISINSTDDTAFHNITKSTDQAINKNEILYVEDSLEEQQREQKEALISTKSVRKSCISLIDSFSSEGNDKSLSNVNTKAITKASDIEQGTRINKKTLSVEAQNVCKNKSTISENSKDDSDEEAILRTPEKRGKSMKTRKLIISDSESDSPNSKASPKLTPTKKWMGPDIKLNLKPLGLSVELDSWVQSVRSKPIMSSMPVTRASLEDRCLQLKDLQIEILNKFYAALDRIPLPILEKFPKFDSKSYQKLKELNQHVKAKIRLGEVKLTQMKKEDEKCVDNISSDNCGENLSVNNALPQLRIKSPQELNTCNDLSWNDDVNFNVGSSTNTIDSLKSKVSQNEFTHVRVEHYQTFTNVAHVNDEEQSPSEELQNSPIQTKMNDSSLQSKRSTFQLKRPVKATLTTQMSKRIGEIWQKNQEKNRSLCATSANSENDDEVSDFGKQENKFENAREIVQEPRIPLQSKLIVQPTTKTVSSQAQQIFQDDMVSKPFVSSSKWIDTPESFDDEPFLREQMIDSLTQELERFPSLDLKYNTTTQLNSQAIGKKTVPSVQKRDVNEKQDTSKQSSKSNTQDTEVGVFTGDYKNDGISGEFNGLMYPHSREMLKIFRQKFGLYSFRPNQLQAINAALLGFDCFVLMPTGGGKSLCYQLPALLTPGVSIVISPLISLIFDQVHKLTSLDIPAAHMASSLNESQSAGIFRELSKQEPGLKLLYVTPEKISASQKFCTTLANLYQRGMLARFIIDEAHCVSAWGHDFRPDYKKLRCLRENYPRVPTIALTATATPRVRTDILHQLGMTRPKWFMSSFNRPNLRYSVITKKGRNCSDEVIAMIKMKYKNDCGIVYCLSRKDCDDYAAQMRKNNLRALSYHAGLTDTQRSDIQGRWISEEVRVVCATIAFGMGIDKPNVRFVIHASLPKSIEGYYQESGRAGRDGENADCILFYNYADVHRIRKLIETDRSAGDIVGTHMDNLYKMVSFCENRTDCRRTLQLNYFGEIFDKSRCIANKSTACDNCRTQGDYSMLDATEEAKHVIKAVREINQKRNAKLTLVLLTDIFKGCDIKKIREAGLNNLALYGRGKSWTRSDIERLMRKLVLDGYLEEHMYIFNEIACAYIRIGPKAAELMNSKDKKVIIPMRSSNSEAIAVATVSAVTRKIDIKMKELHDRCYTELIGIIRGIAGALDVSASSIMNMVAVRSMSQNLPDSEEAMLKIPHVTKANFDKYGKALLDITQKYAAEKYVLMDNQEKEEENSDHDSWCDDSANFYGGSATGTGRKRKSRTYARGGSKRQKRGGGASTQRRKTTTRGRGRGGKTTVNGPGFVTFSAK